MFLTRSDTARWLSSVGGIDLHVFAWDIRVTRDFTFTDNLTCLLTYNRTEDRLTDMPENDPVLHLGPTLLPGCISLMKTDVRRTQTDIGTCTRGRETKGRRSEPSTGLYSRRVVEFDILWFMSEYACHYYTRDGGMSSENCTIKSRLRPLVVVKHQRRKYTREPRHSVLPMPTWKAQTSFIVNRSYTSQDCNDMWRQEKWRPTPCKLYTQCSELWSEAFYCIIMTVSEFKCTVALWSLQASKCRSILF